MGRHRKVHPIAVRVARLRATYSRYVQLVRRWIDARATALTATVTITMAVLFIAGFLGSVPQTDQQATALQLTPALDDEKLPPVTVAPPPRQAPLLSRPVSVRVTETALRQVLPRPAQVKREQAPRVQVQEAKPRPERVPQLQDSRPRPTPSPDPDPPATDPDDEPDSDEPRGDRPGEKLRDWLKEHVKLPRRDEDSVDREERDEPEDDVRSGAEPDDDRDSRSGDSDRGQRGDDAAGPGDDEASDPE